MGFGRGALKGLEELDRALVGRPTKRADFGPQLRLATHAQCVAARERQGHRGVLTNGARQRGADFVQTLLQPLVVVQRTLREGGHNSQPTDSQPTIHISGEVAEHETQKQLTKIQVQRLNASIHGA